MRAIFLGTPVEAPAPSLPYLEQFNKCHHNTGNLAIGCSLLRELTVTDYITAPWPEDLPVGPEEANDRFDRIIIPAANFLYRGFDFGRFADFIEKTSLPCTIVGLGAQAPRANDFELSIPSQGTLRLLNVVADRTKTIGVRGDFSAEVMNRLGFKNVRAVGCPSLYRTLKPEVRIKKRSPESPSLIQPVINGSRNVCAHSYAPDMMKKLESSLLDLAIQNGYYYVIQNEQPELDVLLGNERLARQQADELVAIADELSLQRSPTTFLRHIKNRYKIFFNIDPWVEFLKAFDFSIGTRLHGAILALTSGVPALLITHDSRTSEMAELCKIPHIPIDAAGEMAGDMDVARLYDSTSFDAFEARYRELYDQYLVFLEENGIEHRLQPRASGASDEANQNAVSPTTDPNQAPSALGKNLAMNDDAVQLHDYELISQAVRIRHQGAVKVLQETIDGRGKHIVKLEADLGETTARLIELERNFDFATAHTLEMKFQHADEINALQARLAQSESELAQSESELAQSESERDAIIKSTLWQAMRPVRFLLAAIPKGGRRFVRRVLRVGWWTITLRLPRKLQERREAARLTRQAGD